MIFQPGERITLVHTDDPHTRLRPGDEGTVTRHNKTTAGEVVHVAWDDGSRLSMCLDAGDIIDRIPPAPAGSGPARAAAGGCLLGELHTDGHRYTAVPVVRPTGPGDMIPALRYFWRHTAEGLSGRFTTRVLGNGWAHLDTTGQAPPSHGERIYGIGVTDPNPAAVPAHGDLHHPAPGTDRPGWLYLLDPDWEQIVVYEATVHGRWALHSRQDLYAPPPSPLAGPEPPAGDAATTTGHTHRWREATVALPGLDEAWPAEICAAEQLRGKVVARLHPDVLAAVIPLAESLHRDRRPGSLLPTLHLEALIPQGLQVTWYPAAPTNRPSGSNQTRTGGWSSGHTSCRGRCRPRPPPTARRWSTASPHRSANGPPTPDSMGATPAWPATRCPWSAPPSPRASPQMTAVIATSTTDLGGPVWLVAPGHALLLTPTSHRPTGGRVTPAPAACRHLGGRPTRSRSSPPNRSPPPAPPWQTGSPP